MLPPCGGVGKAGASTFLSPEGWYESMSSQPLAARFRIGIDTGGTFTDIVSVDTLSGKTHVTKVASTPANPAIGLVRGVNEILAAAGATTDDVAGLAHGTTVATNALLQG
ncbi:MAG TPA: hydantoinase/oxoprolinase N-terminal domain-containing protein, partial [Bradyrhizobium sp.]|nr:hydantoinase/oxoprolinase N-terminal domain-containing protein [Bradyrhizobium sp.]